MTDFILTRGTGAGGANTNKNGKPFEEDTNNLKLLLRNYSFIKIKVNLITKFFVKIILKYFMVLNQNTSIK